MRKSPKKGCAAFPACRNVNKPLRHLHMAAAAGRTLHEEDRNMKKRKKSKANTLLTIILVLVFLVGLSLLLYPTVSDYWNSLHQSRAITGYTEQVAGLDTETYDRLWAEAEAYNETLLNKPDRFRMTDEELEEYEQLLSVSGSDVIGYIEIDKIDCYLPIYHGTSESVLQVGVGHLEGSSLPVGGESTHCVVSGHRGLPSARLFTDLDRMEEGDIFSLYVLNEKLSYEVDQILVVEPAEVDALAIEEGEDYCTLVTCTPYGINTHRLLVRGHRVENVEEPVEVQVEAETMETGRAFPLSALLILAAAAILLIAVLLYVALGRSRSRRNGVPEKKRGRKRDGKQRNPKGGIDDEEI